MAVRRLSDLVEFPLFAERVGGGDHFTGADCRLLLWLRCLDICRLKLHLLLLAEGHLALVVNDLLLGSVGVISLSKLVGIVFVKLVEKLTHDVFGLRFINLLALLAVEGQSNLPFVWLDAGHGEHESLHRLLVLLCTKIIQSQFDQFLVSQIVA